MPAIRAVGRRREKRCCPEAATGASGCLLQARRETGARVAPAHPAQTLIALTQGASVCCRSVAAVEKRSRAAFRPPAAIVKLELGPSDEHCSAMASVPNYGKIAERFRHYA